MLGILGWIFMAGAGFKQAAGMQYVADSNRSKAIAEGRIYYRNAQGDCFLVNGGRRVWLKNKYGDQVLEDKNGMIIYNLSKMKRDEQTLKAIEMGRAKAEELGITDRNWLWVKKELGWESYVPNERFDLTTGKRFTIHAYCYLKKSTDKIGGVKRMYLCPKYRLGNIDPITKIQEADYSPIFSFFKEDSDRSKDTSFSHITRDYSLMPGVEKITLTEYLMKWKETLEPDIMEFLLRVGVVKTKCVRYKFLDNPSKKECYGYEMMYRSFVNYVNPDKIVQWKKQCSLTTDFEDIIAIDEEKFAEITSEMNAMFAHKNGRFDKTTAYYEYKSVLDE